MPRSCLSMTASEPRVTISSFPSARVLISTSRKRVNTSREYHVEAKISPWKTLRLSSSRRLRIFLNAPSPNRRWIWLMVSRIAEPLIWTMRFSQRSRTTHNLVLRAYHLHERRIEAVVVMRTAGERIVTQSGSGLVLGALAGHVDGKEERMI